MKKMAAVLEARLSVLMVVTTLSVVPGTSCYRLAHTPPPRHRAHGSYDGDATEVPASLVDSSDQHSRVTQLTKLVNFLDVLRMLKDMNDEDFQTHVGTDYEGGVMLGPVLAAQPSMPVSRPVELPGGGLASLRAGKRSRSWAAKRRTFNCDLRKVTLNTIVEYIRSGKICGFKVSNVRFGLGRK